MAKGYALTESDRQAIQELITRGKSGGDSTRPKKPKSKLPDYKTPEVFIAKAVGGTGGITALEVQESGNDFAGYGVCNIFQIIPNWDTGDYEIQPVGSSEEVVFNLSQDTIGEEGYFLVCRDKFGRWIIPAATTSTRFAWATTTAAVASTDATFSVKSVVMCDGSSYDGDGSTASAPYLSVYNNPFHFGIAADTRGLITYVHKHVGDGWGWYALSFDIDCEQVT